MQKEELKKSKKAMTSLLNELREAVKKPGVFGGGLQTAVSAILERKGKKK
ncbi:MAG: hypothetical protein WCT28_00635 [Patescibacteria group bacterium]|jgi:hypothetical protein